MTPARVLLADNNPQILALYGKYLRDAGYHVATADSPAATRQALDRQWFDLAVIDWRLDDDSEGDHSGYELAGDPLYSHVAKIILTLYPDWQKAVKARTAGPDGCAPAFDYIGKEQTLREFGDAVARALAEATPTDRALLMADATQRRLVAIRGVRAVGLRPASCRVHSYRRSRRLRRKTHRMVAVGPASKRGKLG